MFCNFSISISYYIHTSYEFIIMDYLYSRSLPYLWFDSLHCCGEIVFCIKLPMGPSLYYFTTFLDLFSPTHPLTLRQQSTYWTAAKNAIFLTPPTQSICWLNIGMVSIKKSVAKENPGGFVVCCKWKPSTRYRLRKKFKIWDQKCTTAFCIIFSRVIFTWC